MENKDIMMGIASAYFFIAVVIGIIASFKMGNYLSSHGKEDSWIPGSILGTVVDYVSLTKENTGKIGIWFKLMTYPLVSAMALLVFTFLHYVLKLF